MFAWRRAAGRTDLGRGYHKLWAAATVSYMGDGVYLAALPLLAASLTRDPFLISIVAATGWLPWLLFGLPAGALVDRWDRRGVMWRVDLGRALIIAALVVAIVTGWASIPVLATAGFLLGVGQTLFDSASQALLPTMLGREPTRLGRANSQLIGAQQVSHLAGPPLGGLFFALAKAVPFAIDTLSFLASSMLIATVRGRFNAKQETPAAAAARAGLLTEILGGLRWLLHNPLFRALAVVVGLTNLVVAAGEAILVLLAQERLGLESVGFGFLLASAAAGGGLGSLLTTFTTRRFGSGTVIIGALLVGALSMAGIGATTNPGIAAALMALKGAVFTMVNIVAVSLRQTIVPDRLMGRVVAANRMLVFGVVPLGSILGGVLATKVGLTAPFLIGGMALATISLAALPTINNRTIHTAQTTASEHAHHENLNE